MNKYLNNNLIIHNVISTSIISNHEKDKRSSTSSYNKNSDIIGSKSTQTSTKSLNSCDLKFGSNKKKKTHNKLKSCINFASRVRLYTLTSTYLLSPTLKSRKLFDERCSSKLRSIKEKEDNLIIPFSPSQNEEDEEDQSIEYDGLFKLYSTTIDDANDDNFNNNKNLNNEFMVKRKQTFPNIKRYKIEDYIENISRNKSTKNINKPLLFV